MKTSIITNLFFCFLGFCLSFRAYSQTPIYNSYTSAPATIYLDFDGQFIEGTSWNYSGPLTLGPGNLTNAQISEIFNRVAEDYRPFNLNITTDSTKYWSAPPRQRMRVIFTVTSAWYGLAGGVSYINSFSWGDNTPCFVFTALLNYRTKYIAEAASHEIGHSLGLNHQSAYDIYCNKTEEYNAGKGTGEIAWAPIMGVGYYRNFTLWHNGSNPWGCSNFQDDLSIITSMGNGISYRTDDYSNSLGSTTTQLNFVNSRFSIDGIIEKPTDKDAFKFTMPVQGIFHLDAHPYNVGIGYNGSNLDIKIELLSNNQTILNTYNPDLLLDATIDTLLDAGTYYLRVQSSGNIYAPDYASLGSYTLSAFYASATILPLHHLEIKGISSEGRHNLSWSVEADEKIIQQILELSFDGRNFQPLGSFTAATRKYVYQPNDNNLHYYRMNVVFDNNKQYFSNIIALRNTSTKPFIVNNFVRNLVRVNCPAPFNYTLIDYSGKTVARGRLSAGINGITTTVLTNGVYVIQFSNGQEQYVEKFMKQ